MGDRHETVFPLSASLYTGSGANANLSLATFSTVTFSQKTYANGQGYQTTGGDFRRLYQVEFTGMNISALGGDTISFGVDGLNRGDYPFFNVASNAGLSGSQQDSADGVMSFYKVGSGGATYTGAFQSARERLGQVLGHQCSGLRDYYHSRPRAHDLGDDDARLRRDGLRDASQEGEHPYPSRLIDPVRFEQGARRSKGRQLFCVPDNVRFPSGSDIRRYTAANVHRRPETVVRA